MIRIIRWFQLLCGSGSWWLTNCEEKWDCSRVKLAYLAVSVTRTALSHGNLSQVIEARSVGWIEQAIVLLRTFVAVQLSPRLDWRCGSYAVNHYTQQHCHTCSDTGRSVRSTCIISYHPIFRARQQYLAMQSAVLATINSVSLLSVRPSVRHMLVSCQNDSSYRIMRSSHWRIALSFFMVNFSTRFERGHIIGSEGAEWERRRKNRQFLANKSPYLRNGAR